MPAARPNARPSVRDVAALAGVSVGTVSHVLNHPDRVAPATRERVEAAIAELRFVRSDAARRLREGRSSLVGVVVHDVSNSFFTEAARGVEDRLRAAGCVPMLMSSDAEPERELEALNLLAGMDVRGVVLTPSAASLDNLAVLTERGARVVLMDTPSITDALPTVSGDDVAGARAAIAHLLGLGHRRIGFINGPAVLRQARDRHAGVLAALDAAGFDPAEVLLEREAAVGGKGFTAQAGEVGAADLLDAVEPPTALFCANDQIAIGAMREIRRRGLSIPDDVAIVGYDDVAIARELITPLTSVHVPMYEIGVTAADLLLTEAAAAQHVTFEPELVVRASTAGERAARA